MGSHRSTGPAGAFAEDDREYQTGDTGVDVHGGSTREVDGFELVGDPSPGFPGDTVECEHPVRHREVHERGPQPREHQPATELQPVGDSAGDQCHGDDGEHQLKRHEHRLRDGSGQRDADRFDRFDTGTRIRDDLDNGVAADQSFEPEVLARIAEESEFVIAEGN